MSVLQNTICTLKHRNVINASPFKTLKRMGIVPESVIQRSSFIGKNHVA